MGGSRRGREGPAPATEPVGAYAECILSNQRLCTERCRWSRGQVGDGRERAGIDDDGDARRAKATRVGHSITDLSFVIHDSG